MQERHSIYHMDPRDASHALNAVRMYASLQQFTSVKMTTWLHPQGTGQRHCALREKIYQI